MPGQLFSLTILWSGDLDCLRMWTIPNCECTDTANVCIVWMQGSSYQGCCCGIQYQFSSSIQLSDVDPVFSDYPILGSERWRWPGEREGWWTNSSDIQLFRWTTGSYSMKIGSWLQIANVHTLYYTCFSSHNSDCSTVWPNSSISDSCYVDNVASKRIEWANNCVIGCREKVKYFFWISCRKCHVVSNKLSIVILSEGSPPW